MTRLRLLTFAAAGAAFLGLGAGAALAQDLSGDQGAYQQGYRAGLQAQFHSNFYSGCENWCAPVPSLGSRAANVRSSNFASSYNQGYQTGLREKNVFDSSPD